MRSLRNLAEFPSSIPVTADEIVEFHAARLLLLIRLCGSKAKTDGLPKIEGLTKVAKLDFFVRYPRFFGRITSYLRNGPSDFPHVESSMVRYHYGPWDQRYYHVLAYLESKGLVSVGKQGNTFVFSLTRLGEDAAESLRNKPSFDVLVRQMKAVKKALGSKSGSSLKKLIYEVFREEVTEKKMGEVIG
jgi:DNA-binding PadR family transcriptional regulator